MPNTSAGMVIGKSGANIKDIRETYGCQIQVRKLGNDFAENLIFLLTLGYNLVVVFFPGVPQSGIARG